MTAPLRMRVLRQAIRLAWLLVLGAVVESQVAAESPSGWTLIWSDEFNQADGSPPDTNNWAYEIGAGGWGNNELEYYTSRTNNARIVSGMLVIEADQENYMGSSYTSARLKTQGKWSWDYGRIEARIKLSRGQGIWPAFWMLGTNIASAGWPTCGEIDIMENIGREPRLVHGTIHGPGYSGSNGIGGPCALPGNPVFADDFHVYAVEWTTNQIKWFVDRFEYFSANPAILPPGKTWVFTRPQFLLLNLAVGGFWPGNPDGTTTFPQQLLVDYVRVYAPTNLPVCGANLLSNPGFESGLAGWTAYGNVIPNVLAPNIAQVPVYNGTNVFKVFGQFNGSDNYSGAYQDVLASAGQSFTASGWVLTPSNDQIAGMNTAWVEVSFRDASANILSLYRSAVVDTNTPPGLWLNFAITNQFNPTNFTGLGPATNLVAPATTSFIRSQVVFHQPAQAAGSVLFDDLKLSPSGSFEIPVFAAVSISGFNLNLSFPTFLGLTYQMRYKNDLSDPDWLVLTNVLGDGTAKVVSDPVSMPQRFYQVSFGCN